MALIFTLDPQLTPGLRDEITTLWTDVSNADGAVGFVPPVTAAQVRPTADKQFAGVADGPDRLLTGRDPATGGLAAVLFFEDQRFDLMAHWQLLKRVMVAPEHQGRGYGAELLAEAERLARAWGLSGLRLTLRGGRDLETFYARSGYKEVGRVPGAIRVAPGEEYDDVTMWLDLR
ncbi:GNAT family N-acetyltransferase [Streptacidiphilus sp. PB12-B1b]|uniref:GNAT family N-acetyltransferase n=1 Tax=Streptacidiphilus sp. PB12-B1b TaxID=2705012 RepID=UPI0015FD308A|nr:GNAT family N-acetyltransferase [Streptacidiphilus sp. PB12-B1b]QMU74962.1 GNAT family N-acetyltransferase [Streptacidiphilus sp. PB12-B1b]